MADRDVAIHQGWLGQLCGIVVGMGGAEARAMRGVVVAAVVLVGPVAHANPDQTSNPVPQPDPEADAATDATHTSGAPAEVEDPPRKVENPVMDPKNEDERRQPRQHVRDLLGSRLGASLAIGAEFDRFSTISTDVATCGRIVKDDGCFGTRNTWGPSAVLDIGYRVLPALAVGVHAAISLQTKMVSNWEANNESDPAAFQRWNAVSYTPMRIGANAQLTMLDRLWLAPWLGLETGAAYESPKGPQLAYGLGIGADIIKFDHARIGLRGDGLASPNHLYFSLGLAARYW